MSQLVRVMIIVVVVIVVMVICIRGEQNPCWFHSLSRILKMTVSLYVIAGPLLVLPTQLLTTSNYCPNRMVNNFGLRRLFYSKRCFKNDCCSST